ncbi:hypothetical protein B0H10DRAFT_1942181 [Mycena sp. CBHHK59/15]|nr:hypothetical protein B0H10DRAFT_1942181 [Mycena sp. CBHHK59/15]
MSVAELGEKIAVRCLGIGVSMDLSCCRRLVQRCAPTPSSLDALRLNPFHLAPGSASNRYCLDGGIHALSQSDIHVCPVPPSPRLAPADLRVAVVSYIHLAVATVLSNRSFQTCFPSPQLRLAFDQASSLTVGYRLSLLPAGVPTSFRKTYHGHSPFLTIRSLLDHHQPYASTTITSTPLPVYELHTPHMQAHPSRDHHRNAGDDVRPCQRRTKRTRRARLILRLAHKLIRDAPDDLRRSGNDGRIGPGSAPAAVDNLALGDEPAAATPLGAHFRCASMGRSGHVIAWTPALTGRCFGHGLHSTSSARRSSSRRDVWVLCALAARLGWGITFRLLLHHPRAPATRLGCAYWDSGPRRPFVHHLALVSPGEDSTLVGVESWCDPRQPAAPPHFQAQDAPSTRDDDPATRAIEEPNGSCDQLHQQVP